MDDEDSSTDEEKELAKLKTIVEETEKQGSGDVDMQALD